MVNNGAPRELIKAKIDQQGTDAENFSINHSIKRLKDAKNYVLVKGTFDVSKLSIEDSYEDKVVKKTWIKYIYRHPLSEPYQKSSNDFCYGQIRGNYDSI